MSGRDGGLTREVLAAAGDRRRDATLARTERYFLTISKLDYTSRLARRFDRGQLNGMLGELRGSLPALNRCVFRETNLARLASIAHELGVILQIESQSGVEIRGFYLNDAAIFKRPLIVLNTANVAVSVAATFGHEIGHHLTHGIFGERRDRLNLTFASNYRDILDDPQELCADILMTLAAYPVL